MRDNSGESSLHPVRDVHVQYVHKAWEWANRNKIATLFRGKYTTRNEVNGDSFIRRCNRVTNSPSDKLPTYLLTHITSQFHDKIIPLSSSTASGSKPSSQKLSNIINEASKIKTLEVILKVKVKVK
jgi:hypothetical protein